jgi:hypothetical protein
MLGEAVRFPCLKIVAMMWSESVFATCLCK